MCSDYIHPLPQAFFNSPPFPIHPTSFHCLAILPDQFVLPNIFSFIVFYLKWLTYKELHSKRKLILSFSVAKFADGFMAWGRPVCPTLLYLLQFGMAWAWTGFLHTMSTSESSYMELPYHIKVFPCSHPLSLFHTHVFALFHNDPWELGGSYNICVSFITQHSVVLYSLKFD